MINVGISRVHSSSVALLQDGELVFHIENERYSRIKYDRFPFSALFKIKDYVDHIDNLCIAGLHKQIPHFDWVNDDGYSTFVYHLNKSFIEAGFTIHDLGLEHHRMHASCAFYNSGFEEAVCIVSDGMGSDALWTAGGHDHWLGREKLSTWSCKYPAEIEPIAKHIYHPAPIPDNIQHHQAHIGDHRTDLMKYIINDNVSPGLAFEITAESLGFHPLAAGTIMGMSSYGKEDSTLPPIYKNGKIDNEVIHDSGEIRRINLDYESWEFQDQANFAFALQKETQENMKKFIHSTIKKTKCKNICLSGGFFLNCVANYEYLDGLPEDVNLYIEPISSDAGTSIGAANYVYHLQTNDPTVKKQNTLYHGPEPDYTFMEKKLNKFFEAWSWDREVKYENVISLILNGNPVALYQGKSESGPRALGNRSIIYDPRDKDGKDVVNTIKNREWFRPFAGTVLHEKADEWFDMRGLKESPFMMYAMNVKKHKVNKIPAITHVDGTCRVQTLTKDQNFHFYNLIKFFYDQTGVPILFNTSFNLAGDPLVETIEDALYTLKNSNLRYLYLPEKKWMIIKNKLRRPNPVRLS